MRVSRERLVRDPRRWRRSAHPALAQTLGRERRGRAGAAYLRLGPAGALPAPGRCSEPGAASGGRSEPHRTLPPAGPGAEGGPPLYLQGEAVPGGAAAGRRAGQGGLAGAGCHRVLPSGRKTPKPGNAERGSASPGRSRARDRGQEGSEKNPSGSRGGDWRVSSWQAERRCASRDPAAGRERVSFGAGFQGSGRGREKGKRLPPPAWAPRGVPAFPPLRPPPPRGLGRVRPVSCRSASCASGSREQVLAESSPTNRLWRCQLTETRAPLEGEAGVLLAEAVRREVLTPRLERAPGGLRALPLPGVLTARLGPGAPFPVPNR